MFRCEHCYTKVKPGNVYCDACRLVIYGIVETKPCDGTPFSCPPPSKWTPKEKKP